MSDIKFAHGTRANAEAAVADGRLDPDDLIIFSDTDDEIGIVNHNKELKRIKARTNEDIVLTDEDIDLIPGGYTVPAGTSIDDLVNLFKTWLTDNKDNINFSKNSLSPATADTLGGIKVGDGLEVDNDGTLSANNNSNSNAIEWVGSKIAAYDAETTYNKGDYVSMTINEDGQKNVMLWIFESLTDNNLGNEPSDKLVDTNYWKSIGNYVTVLKFLDDAVEEGGIPIISTDLSYGALKATVRTPESMSATDNHIGFVKPGKGLSVDDEGTLNVTSSGGLENKLLTTIDLGDGEYQRYNCVIKIYTQYITVTLTTLSDESVEPLVLDGLGTQQRLSCEAWDASGVESAALALYTPMLNYTGYVDYENTLQLQLNYALTDAGARAEAALPVLGYFSINNCSAYLDISGSFPTPGTDQHYQMPGITTQQTFTFLNANALPTE